MSIDLGKFKHRHPYRVRTYHVDRQNVVHYLWYMFFFEEARLEYLRHVGFPIDPEVFLSHTKFSVVRNDSAYFGPAVFDDELELYTRIAYVKNSSMGFEQACVRKQDGFITTSLSHVMAYVDADTGRPQRLPDDMRELIRAFEREDVEFVG